MDDPRSILIIQLKRAGDILVTTPLLPAFKRRFPRTHLGFLCNKGFASILENNPSLDVIEPYDGEDVLGTIRRIRKQKYEWVFDFQSSPRSAIVCLGSGARLTAGYRVPFWGRTYGHSVRRPSGSQSVVEGKFSLAESVAGPLGDRPPRQLMLREEERAWAVEKMPTGPQKPIGLVPTHRRNSRRWPAASFADLARLLSQENQDVWLFWGPGEKEYVADISRQAPGTRMIPETTLRQMAALFERCKLVITNDNGPMHLAVSVGAPTLTVYGPTDPVAWNPGGPNHQIIQAHDVPCLGCNLNECPFNHECMTHVSAREMLERVRPLWITPSAAGAQS